MVSLSSDEINDPQWIEILRKLEMKYANRKARLKRPTGVEISGLEFSDVECDAPCIVDKLWNNKTYEARMAMLDLFTEKRIEIGQLFDGLDEYDQEIRRSSMDAIMQLLISQ